MEKKGWMFVLLILLVLPMVVAKDWVRPSFWSYEGNILTTNYNVLIRGNLTITGDYVNITVTNYNVTNNLNVIGSITANNFIGDGSQLTGTSLWTNSSGAATYILGNVGIGTITPDNKLDVIGNTNISGNLTILGTLFGGSPVKIDGINIINNLFMLEENRNSSSRFTLTNTNESINATAVISTINNVGGTMSIGIGSSNFMIGGTSYPNVTALFSKARGKTVFANFYNYSFSWMFNPSDNNNPANLETMIVLDAKGLNISRGSLFLGEFETSAQGGAKVVKRSNANGALFGISNPIAGANPTSGAGYVTIQDCGNYTVDAHSSLDTNNPNGVVHHLRGCLVDENWRLNPGNVSSSFDFEDGINNELFKINRTSTFIFNDLTLGNSTNPLNITMFSPDGTAYNCGVGNGGTWGCQ